MDSADQQLVTVISTIEAELDSIYEVESQKAAFIARARYVKEGETNSKYFFGMGKRNYVNKTMYCVRQQNGRLTKDYSEILNTQKEYYSKLFRSNSNIQFNIKNKSGIKLQPQQNYYLDEEITYHDMLEALKSTKPERTPGLDGLSREFYIKFFDQLKEPLLCMYKQAFVE